MQADAEICYSQLIKQASLAHCTIPENASDGATMRLMPRFKACLTAGLLEKAYELAMRYRECITSTQGLRLLEDMIQMPDSIPTADARVGLVSASRSLGIKVDSEELLSKAEDIYQDREYRRGLLEVRLARTSLTSVGRNAEHEQAVIHELESLCEEFEQLHLPYGKLRCMSKLRAFLNSPSTSDQEIRTLRKMKEFSDTIGDKFTSAAIRLDIATSLQHRTVEYGTLLADMESLWAELNDTGCHYFAGQAAFLCGSMHSIRRDGPKALEWAQRCVNKFEYCLPEDRERAKTLHVRAGDLIGAKQSDGSWGDELESIKKDRNSGHLDSAAMKMAFLLNREITDGGAALDPTDSRICELMDDLARLVPDLGARRIQAQVDLTRVRIRLASARAGKEESTTADASGIASMEEMVRICDQNNMQLISIDLLLNGAILYDMIFSKKRSGQSFKDTYMCWDRTELLCHKFNVPGYMLRASYGKAYCCYQAWKFGIEEVTPDLVLQAISPVRSLCREERLGFSILSGLKAIEMKRAPEYQDILQKTTQMAFEACIATKKYRELWSLVQEAKATSMSDLMDFGNLMPAHLRDHIRHDSHLISLLEREASLFESLWQPELDKPFDRPKAKQELDEVRDAIRKSEVLQRLYSLREGTALTLEEAQKLASQKIWAGGFDRRMIFVDWFICRNKVFLLVLKEEGEPQLIGTHGQVSDLIKWKQDNWGTVEARDQTLTTIEPSESLLRRLDFLVSPLANCCKAEDLLVLSPSGAMHSIPLHALWIKDGEELIEANPVVYCASLTTFANCMQKTSCPRSRIRPGRRTAVAVFEPNHRGFNETEQKSIYASIDMLARDHRLEWMERPPDDVNAKTIAREAFIQELAHASWFHFHGHCDFSSPSITEQCLVLTKDRVTVEDLFASLLDSPHVTLIACDSASQTIAAGDEPLGLVTALLCAGASSVVGSIWPIRSSVGREFSSKFYTAVSNGAKSTGSKSGIIDLAVALRDAVLELKSDMNTGRPSDWASFVLHGSYLVNMDRWVGSCD